MEQEYTLQKVMTFYISQPEYRAYATKHDTGRTRGHWQDTGRTLTHRTHSASAHSVDSWPLAWPWLRGGVFSGHTARRGPLLTRPTLKICKGLNPPPPPNHAAGELGGGGDLALARPISGSHPSPPSPRIPYLSSFPCPFVPEQLLLPHIPNRTPRKYCLVGIPLPH